MEGTLKFYEGLVSLFKDADYGPEDMQAIVRKIGVKFIIMEAMIASGKLNGEEIMNLAKNLSAGHFPWEAAIRTGKLSFEQATAWAQGYECLRAIVEVFDPDERQILELLNLSRFTSYFPQLADDLGFDAGKIMFIYRNHREFWRPMNAKNFIKNGKLSPSQILEICEKEDDREVWEIGRAQIKTFDK